MPHPRKVNDKQRAMLREIAVMRRQIAEVYRTLPSNKRLAREMGVSKSAIEQILLQELAAYDAEAERKLVLNSVSCETDSADNAAPWPPESMERTPNVCGSASNLVSS